MAKSKSRKSKVDGWFRSGGAYGDPGMEDQRVFNEDEAAGVNPRKVRVVDQDANSDMEYLPRQKGAE